MAVERTPAGSSPIDVLDRVLDKAVVVDAYVRDSFVGGDPVTVEARFVVAAIDTYLKCAEAIGVMQPVTGTPEPAGDAADPDRVLAENAGLKQKLGDLS